MKGRYKSLSPVSLASFTAQPTPSHLLIIFLHGKSLCPHLYSCYTWSSWQHLTVLSTLSFENTLFSWLLISIFNFIFLFYFPYLHCRLLHLILIMRSASDNLKALKHRVLASQILGSSGILPSDAKFLKDQKKIEILLYFVLHEV